VEDGVERGPYGDLARTADLLARSEHNLRAAVIADLRGLVEQSFTLDNGDDELAELVYVDSIELLVETYEAQNG